MSLYKHQIDAIEKGRAVLDEHGVVLIAADMRTGKTLVGLSLFEGESVLFVTKARAISGIEQDVLKFQSWGLSIDVEVVSYDSLHKVDSDRFTGLILDECHRFSSFPKRSGRCKALQKIYKRCSGGREVKTVLLSGTPTVESICQCYHMFRITGHGPWTEYRGVENGFYSWYKDYGKLGKIRIAGGREVNDYSKGHYDRIMKKIEPYTVSLTQADAGFKKEALVKTHQLQNDMILHLGSEIKEKGVLSIQGRYVPALGIAQKLQKAHMLCGGTCIDEDEEAFVLPEEYDPCYKARYIKEKAVEGRQYAIFTAYREERVLLRDYLGDGATEDMELFKAGGAQYFIGSMISWAEGVDLSWMSGSLILYSLAWSGATYLQILQRMNNKLRDEDIYIHVLCLEGGTDMDVLRAVRSKQNFNVKFMRDAK